MAMNVDNPREVGADRLVNALAAYELHGGPGIVVDFGTATSFAVYNAKGVFLGGAIAPGVATSVRALSLRGAQLPRIELQSPKSPIGRGTVEAMRAGTVYGFAGLVDRIVSETTAELAGDSGGQGGSEPPIPPVVVATGGLAPSILQACRSIQHHDPWLTLKGLRIVWDRNTDET
jgi:type III pantothenate kinase